MNDESRCRSRQRSPSSAVSCRRNPGSGSMRSTIWLGSARRAIRQEGQRRDAVGEQPHLGDPLGERLARPQEDRHPGPAPVVDLHAAAQRRSRSCELLGHPVDVGVAAYWPRTQRCGSIAGIARRTSAFLSLRSSALGPTGGSIATPGEHLQQMVLHDVAQGADPVVELAAVLDAEVLGHRDLDFGDDCCGSTARPAPGCRTAGTPVRRPVPCPGSGPPGRSGLRPAPRAAAR